MNRLDTEDGRFYFVVTSADGSGVYLPSVTTMLDLISKPFLNKWYGKLGNDEAELQSTHAKAVGSEVHNFIEKFAKENYKIETEEWNATAQEVQNGLRAYVRFCQEYKWVPYEPGVATETSVYSLKYGYAGTRDALGWVDITRELANKYGVPELTNKTVFVIVDWKTSKRHSIEHTMQLAAYFVAGVDMENVRPQAGLIVRLDKATGQPDVKLVTLQEMKIAFRAFLHLTYLWRYINADLMVKIIGEEG